MEVARRGAEQVQVAVRGAAEEGQRILQRQGASEATKFLATQPAKFRETPQFRALAEVVAGQLALEALDQRLSSNPDPEAQVRVAEAALRENPGHEEIKKRLAAVRIRQEQVGAI